MHRLSGKFHLIPTSRHLRLCEYVPETKRAAKRPSQGSGRPKCKREWVAEDRFGSFSTDSSGIVGWLMSASARKRRTGAEPEAFATGSGGSSTGSNNVVDGDVL